MLNSKVELERQWTNADGTKTFTGRITDLSDKTVTIEKKDQKSFVVPIDKLSKDDILYLEKVRIQMKAEKVKVAKTSDNIVERNNLHYKENQTTPFTGLVRLLHPNGKTKEETRYKDGKKHGAKTYYFDNGKKQGEYNFKEGKFHGVQTAWQENGNKWTEDNYKDGIRHGLETSWHENGQKSTERSYKDGKLQLKKTSWFPNGQIFIKTDRRGEETMWDENGKKIR